MAEPLCEEPLVAYYCQCHALQIYGRNHLEVCVFSVILFLFMQVFSLLVFLAPSILSQ
jgi:hypothetical protein